MTRPKKSYVPVNKWTSSGSTSIPHSNTQKPVTESHWETVPVVNYSDSPTVSDGDCVGSFKVGSSTSLNTDNQGIRRRVLNYYSKSVTCPITSREDPNRHVTCMDVARTGGMWLLGDDHGSLTVFRGGTTVKRFRLPNLPTSYTLPEGIPGPVSPNGYVEVVKWACDGSFISTPSQNCDWVLPNSSTSALARTKPSIDARRASLYPITEP